MRAGQFDLLVLRFLPLFAVPLPPPPPIRSLVLDLLLLTVVVFPVAPFPPPPPPMRSLVFEPPKPGTVNCADADNPGPITNAVVTTASNMPLNRMPMAILPNRQLHRADRVNFTRDLHTGLHRGRGRPRSSAVRLSS